ncbi:GNAT family N-acetyltransferase [Tsuneonella mangrovi]|uniref:GNAT family N-acetyltransferase n=1 Tax=Tsuneonella mangrovi TaxID=1982042 RepID=UPI00196AD387|nr:GNAT family N-acetyltransferase [Tsuneonella mangrovi]
MQADQIELGGELHRSLSDEADKIGEITADAFRNDPMMAWMVGRFPAISALFHHQARRIYTPRGFCYRHADEGACMWMLPGGNTDFSLGDYAAIGWSTLLHAGPGALIRAIKTGNAMDANHPHFEHAYLFSIGVRQRSQGKGLGRKLIQPVLDACDREGIPAYLENSNPNNTGFYRSCGFEETGAVIRPEPDSPPLVPMVRQPRN